MTRAKVKCQYCGKQITVNNIVRHEKCCINKIHKYSKYSKYDECIQKLSDGDFKCMICGKVFNKKGIYTHVWRKHTPQGWQFTDKMRQLQKDPTKWKRSNGAIKAKQLGITWDVPETTRKKLSEASKKQVWTEERRLNHRKAMRNAVKAHPESYNSKNRGRVKQFEKYGIIFQGSWELYFYEYCISKNINVIRNNQGFNYIWNGNRKYFPDFYLPDFNFYVEVKGYKTERDQHKWQQFEEKLIIIDKHQIDIILSGNDINLIDCIYEKD